METSLSAFVGFELIPKRKIKEREKGGKLKLCQIDLGGQSFYSCYFALSFSDKASVFAAHSEGGLHVLTLYSAWIHFVRDSDNVFLKSPYSMIGTVETGVLFLSDFATEGSSLKTRWGRRERINNLPDQIVQS